MLRSIIASLSLTTALLATSVPATAFAGEDDTAIEVFREGDDEVRKMVKAGASDEKLQKVVDELLDYDWLAKASLGGPKRYAKRCGDQCDEFEKVLTELIRENYLRRIRNQDKGKVEYLKETVRGQVAKVDTRVQFEQNGRQQSIEISYVMHQTDKGWQVRDIITDDVSLAKTYRHEFNEIGKKEGIDGLIARIKRKLAELDTVASSG